MSDSFNRSRLRLLLIEDDPSQLALLAKYLRREHFDVVTCQGLESAISIADRESFAIAVVDLDLNGESGLEFARNLARKQTKTRVIIHTAHSTFESMRDGLNLGVFAYVEKLSEFSQLIEYVHRAASAYLNDNLNAAKEEIVLQLRLLDAVDQGIVATDLDGKLIYWNQYAKTITGLTRVEAIGERLVDHVVPVSMTESELLRCIANGKNLQGECKITVNKEQSALSRYGLHDYADSIPVRMVLSPVLNTRGLVVGAVGSFRDISAEKLSELKIANRAKLLTISAELGHLAIESPDRNAFFEKAIGKLVANFPLDCGRVLLQTIGNQRLETAVQIGQIPPDLKNFFKQASSLELSPHALVVVGDGETQWCRPVFRDGAVHSLRGFRAPIFQDDQVVGCIEGYFASCRPTSDDELDFLDSIASLITGVLQRDRANRLWQSLFDNALEAVMITDEQGRFINMNSAASEMFGYSKQDLSQKTLLDLMGTGTFPHQSIDENRDTVEGMSRNEVELVRKDQTTIIAEVGTIADILPGISISVLRDITKGKRSDHIISEQNDQLSHVQRLATMGSLAAFLAHEINQPLGTISLLSGGLIMSREAAVSKDRELIETLELISREALKAGAIVNRLRKFITLNSFEPAQVNVNQVIRETVQVLKNYLANTDVQISLKLHDQMPSVTADAIRLEQVLVNLIRNAVEAMSDNDANDRLIEIESTIENGALQIDVNDCGPLLTQTRFEKFLTPYYSTKAEGLGMGLCISRSIVEQHGGTLSMIQLQPRGIRGRIRLPITSLIDKVFTIKSPEPLVPSIEMPGA